MDKSLKKKVLIVTIILSLAIIFVPVYFFVLADEPDNNKYTINSKKIIAIEDGSDYLDANDDVGNDSSYHNNRVRTFDRIKYTVEYRLIAKPGESPSTNVEGRNVMVEVLVPTQYEAKLKYGESTTVNMDERMSADNILTFGDNSYYYGTFNVQAQNLNESSTFDFYLNNINSTDITNYSTIKPLIFIRESTDNDSKSIKELNALPEDITCELSTTVTDPDTGATSTTTSNNCIVNITGKEEYFVNMYSGNKKTMEDGTAKIPIGLLIGLKYDSNKGIKGLIVPKNISFAITSSNTAKLNFDENSEAPYRSNAITNNYTINNEDGGELPTLENGTITGSVSDGTMTINLQDIKDYLIEPYGEPTKYYYFASDYIVTTLAKRENYDYSDINVTLSSTARNSNGELSETSIQDSYNYVFGNYSSNVDIYETSLTSENEGDPLRYGVANINYGADFSVKTSFSYSGRSNSSGDGLTSLINYIKIDNDAFELIENEDHASYSFEANYIDNHPSMKIKVDGNPQVLFGFGKWDNNYFVATNADGCPTIDFNNKEQLMNLYGGPCLAATNQVQWAYSPASSNDINGQTIENKTALIVKSEYVPYDNGYIELGSSGSIKLYGTVIEDSNIVNTAHQIVTCGNAYGKNSSDFAYLGNESINGFTMLSNPSNFIKTNYDFTNRVVTTLNDNVCNNAICAVSGNTILISGIRTSAPTFTSHKSIDLSQNEDHFYYYPLALKINSNATKKDVELKYEKIIVDVYLPTYMSVVDNYGTNNEKSFTTVDTTLSAIYTKLNKGTLLKDVNYKIYHYELTAESNGMTDEEKSNLQKGILSNFVIYADIDPINTPNGVQPEIYATIDYVANKNIVLEGNEVRQLNIRPITTDIERTTELNQITLYNSTAVITKASATPKNIEKNGTYSYNMLAYNHSGSIVTGGYEYPTAELIYVLPYNNDLSSDISSNIGTTKYKVSFTSESIAAITASDYKFYYATTGTPSNIILDESKITSTPSAIWNSWEDPTVPVSNVLAIKVVKQSPFGVGTYFGSDQGLTVNVETVGSNDGNSFYNSFHILASKPDNYTCVDDPNDPGYCEESSQNKANYASSTSVTSVYAREISGFVFEDYDYNGIYTSEESKLKDIPVSLYKIDEIPSNYDSTDPSTFVKETDKLVGATVTGENGNYFFGGLSRGNYYVSYTIDNTKYIVTDLEKTDETISDSANNNSTASLLPNTNRAVSKVISFSEDGNSGPLTYRNINLGLAIKKEMAISLNKYITTVTVSKNGKVDTYDYSDQNTSQVSITVLNPKDTHIQVKYSFSIENTKYFPGYVGMIVDSMPNGMTFDPKIKENQYWSLYDNVLYYNGLSGKLLLPNEKQYFTLVLDLDLKEAGTYRNVVSAKDITLMGEELPVYNFSGTSTNSNQGGE